MPGAAGEMEAKLPVASCLILSELNLGASGNEEEECLRPS